MKVLTLHQPWASLVVLGVKTIETRSWSTKYRGPLAIHAAASSDGFYELAGDCEGTTESGWRYGYLGQWQASYCYRTSDEGTRGQAEMVDLEGNGDVLTLPLGAIVATCTLVDVVPIIDDDTGPRCVLPHFSVGANAYGYLFPAEMPELGWYLPDDEPVEMVDQLPYGDFTPGRFAWLLADIVPVDPPVPFKGGQGLTKTWTP